MSLEPRGMLPLNKDRFLSVGKLIHVSPTFEQAWLIPRHAVIGGS